MNPTQPVTPIAGASTALPPLPVTPLRQLRSYAGVWLKCEHENPTGSHKDRAYWSMIAPRAASLAGRTLIDYTSGNGGISLAWFARELGISAVVFMPEGMTQQRIDRIRSYGAKLVLTPQAGFIAAARAAAEAYAAENPEVELLSQSDNVDNEGGFNVVGEEIVQQCAAIGLRPAAFVCAIGTGASFSGIARILKGAFGADALTAIGIEVPEAPVIWAKRRGQTIVPGIPSIIGMGAGKIAKTTDETLIDDIELIGAFDVSAVMSNIRELDGLYVGPSTAANILVASRIAEQRGVDVITMSFDRGDRYPDA